MNDNSPVRSPESEPGAHTYAPRWWYPTATGVFTFALFAVASAAFGMSVISVFVVPVIAAVMIRHLMTIELWAEGVTLNGKMVSWDRLQLTKGRFGESLTAPSEGPGRRRANIQLWVYEREWRTGRIGADVRRWAPGILAESDAML